MKVKNDHRSKFSNLRIWEEEASKKKPGLQRDSDPVLLKAEIREWQKRQQNIRSS